VTRLLLDANFGPRTAGFLADRFAFDASSVIERGLGHLTDEDVVALAIREERVILTFDLDFGEIFHRREHGRFGVIVVRTRDQTVDAVNRLLDSFFSTEAPTIALERALVVIGERRIRVETLD
jgi:predicted nuclease of predicted toxin-antitoxin system